MKTLHLSIIIGSGIIISIITGIMFISGILETTSQNLDNVRTHGLPDLPYFTLFFNGTSDSLSPIQFAVRQGQNITLVVNVTSTPENLPTTLYTEPHIGFTTTNGMDLKLSSAHVTTPSTVFLHISIGKDATPNKYRTRVFATNMNDTLGTDVGITVKPQNSDEQFSITGSKITSIYDSGVTPMSATVTNANFTINYNIVGGQVSEIKQDKQSNSLILSLNATSNGTLIVSIPRALLDSKENNQDTQFIVLMDGQEVKYGETTSMTARTLTIPFESGSEKIQIIATQRI